MTQIGIPELSLVLIVGPSGAGKSSFCRRHFLPTEVVSSDQCRAMVCDDELAQEVTAQAFDILHRIVEARLKFGRLTVVDATNVEPEARRPLIALAKKYHVAVVAVVLDMAVDVCVARNDGRSHLRPNSRPYVERQASVLERTIAGLAQEGVSHLHRLATPDEVAAVTFSRQRLPANRRDDHGPFDLIGDIHGCYDELCELLAKLGYTRQQDTSVAGGGFVHPEGRRALFLGDFVDRGPKIVETASLVINMCQSGSALCILGNHELKLRKYLEGRQVKVGHGLAESISQLASQSEDFRLSLATFIDTLVDHFVLGGGKLVVAHAGLREELHGRMSGVVRAFALYGQTTGERDAQGLPIRVDWAKDYRGKAAVVYGHTAVPRAEWVNNTICIDTGCVYGGKLSALRWPESELVAVAAKRRYYDFLSPMGPSTDWGDESA